MTANAPVIIITDDEDDTIIIQEVWKELNLEFPLVFFTEAKGLLNYLSSVDLIPFLIISEIDLPGMDGFKLKETLMKDSSNNYKTIPFIFMSGTASDQVVKKAYDVCSHGFFIKDTSFESLKQNFLNVINYWRIIKVPE